MRLVIANGADLTRSMRIDFQIDCPDLATARAIGARVPRDEFEVSVYQNPGRTDATCECSRYMLLEHSELVRIQARLSELAEPFGCRCVAWGTFGNKQGAEPDATP